MPEKNASNFGVAGGICGQFLGLGIGQGSFFGEPPGVRGFFSRSTRLDPMGSWCAWPSWEDVNLGFIGQGSFFRNQPLLLVAPACNKTRSTDALGPDGFLVCLVEAAGRERSQLKKKKRQQEAGKRLCMGKTKGRRVLNTKMHKRQDGLIAPRGRT